MSQTVNNNLFKNRNTLLIVRAMFLNNAAFSKTIGLWETGG
jgi:hypothetical protein